MIVQLLYWALVIFISTFQGVPSIVDLKSGSKELLGGVILNTLNFGFFLETSKATAIFCASYIVPLIPFSANLKTSVTNSGVPWSISMFLAESFNMFSTISLASFLDKLASLAKLNINLDLPLSRLALAKIVLLTWGFVSIIFLAPLLAICSATPFNNPFIVCDSEALGT